MGPRRIFRKFGLLAAILACSATCQAGSIVGTVRAVPPKGGGEQSGGGGAYESRRYKYVEKIDYDIIDPGVDPAYRGRGFTPSCQRVECRRAPPMPILMITALHQLAH